MSEELMLCGGEWNGFMVVLSCIVAVGGSFAALDCADRMHAATERRSRRHYLLAGATLMGVAIWTMHFVGMLALNLGVLVNYDILLSAISVAAAALGAALAFAIVNRRTVTRFHFIFGGLAMGLAIASMHYLGMASMRLPATIHYDPLRFTGSIAIAVAASGGALGLARRRVSHGRTQHWVKPLSAVAMGAAIAGMHYVGMAAARYVPSGRDVAGEGATVGPWSLQDLLVGAGLVIVIALLALAGKNAAERQQALESLEEKQAEAVAASRAKDAFLASLSHELRTPLNPALLLATDAAGNPEFPASAREAFASIARSIRIEARLIDDLLDLTRISRGVLKLEPRAIDLHAVVREAIAIVDPALRERKLHLQCTLAAVQTTVMGDFDRLQQVFWNLLQNAAKFSHDGSRITLHTRNRDDRIEVSIHDSGIGMTAAEIARCFEAFGQGDHRRGGLGLGLAISRNIVEAHQGSLVASSPGPNEGATFTASFTTTAAPAEPPDAAPATGALPAPGRSLTILLVEDHGPSRSVMESLLKRRGHEVAAAGTVQEALQHAQARTFDLLVSDIGLPDGTGHDIMQQLRQRGPLAGIAVTGYGMEGDIQRATASGFCAHLVKPVTQRRLDEAIAIALRVAGPGAAAATATVAGLSTTPRASQ